MITTNMEMIRQVYSEMERRLKMEFHEMQENAYYDDSELTKADYDNLRDWLMGALQGIYSVFHALSSNWSDTVTFMRECEENSELITYFATFKYEELFNE